jgi:cell division protein FtsL
MLMAQTLHREADRRARRSMARGLALSGLLVVVMLGIVGAKVQQTRLAYELGTLRSTVRQLDELQHQLQVELAMLRSPGRIEVEARALGLVAPTRDQLVLAREYVIGGGAGARVAQGDLPGGVGVR